MPGEAPNKSFLKSWLRTSFSYSCRSRKKTTLNGSFSVGIVTKVAKMDSSLFRNAREKRKRRGSTKPGEAAQKEDAGKYLDMSLRRKTSNISLLRNITEDNHEYKMVKNSFRAF